MSVLNHKGYCRKYESILKYITLPVLYMHGLFMEVFLLFDS